VSKDNIIQLIQDSANERRRSSVTGMRPPPRGRAIDLRYSLA
jgi:hypothetical protein